MAVSVNIVTKQIYREIYEYIKEGKSACLSATIPAKDEGSVSEIGISVSALESYENEADNGITFAAEDDGRRILTEPFTAPERLVILGGGHVSLAVCDIAHLCGFYVMVTDDRPEYANTERFKNADEVRCGEFQDVIDQIKPRRSDYFLIVTRGHEKETECIEALFAYPESRYVGLMGSARRTKALRAALEGAGLDGERLGRIHMPVGLPIGAENVNEIAVSIMAQLIEIRRNKNTGNKHAGSEAAGNESERSGNAGNVSVRNESERNETAGSKNAKKRKAPDHDKEILEILSGSEQECAAAMIVSTEGSSPRGAGARMIVYKDGSMKGTIGGGEVEGKAFEECRSLIGTGNYRLIEIERDSEEELSKGKVCGGRVRVLICDLV